MEPLTKAVVAAMPLRPRQGLLTPVCNVRSNGMWSGLTGRRAPRGGIRLVKVRASFSAMDQVPCLVQPSQIV